MISAYTLASIAAELLANGHHGRAECLREVERENERLRRDNETLQSEIVNMARKFTEAAQVLVDYAKAKTAEAEKLKTDLADAMAKAKTPEDLAAEQTVIDAAETSVPSEPLAV